MPTGDPRPARPLRIAAWCALGATGALAAVLLLWPSGAEVRELHIAVWHWTWRRLGAPGWFTPEASEQLANALVLLVPTAAATVLAHRRHWGWPLGIGAAIGVVIELLQWALLPERLPDPVDAAANAIGAAVGVAIGVALRRAGRAARPERG